MSSLLHMLLLICCLFHSGVSQNSKITCPRPYYKEGSSALNLTIDSSTFSGCDIGPTSVTCSWYPETGTESVVCIQSVTSCDQTLTNRGCRCNSMSGQVYDYSLSFSMLPGEERGNISCSLDCIVLPGNPGPKATVESDQTCLNIDFVSKCKTFGCQRGVCRINGTEPICDCTGTDYEGKYCEVDPCENTKCQRDGICEIDGATPQCNCEGTYHTNDACEVDPCQNKTNCCVTTYPHEAYIMNDSIDIVIIIILGVPLFVAVLIIVLLISFIIWLRWKKKFQSVISIIVHVETKEKKILQSLATKKYLHRFIYKDFTLYCCCCCWFSWCCWRGWCCLGGIIKGEKSDNQTSVGCDEIVAGCDDCDLCCMWCLSTADKVNVDVFCDKDKRALVLVTLESTLSWYFDAEDMPAKVKNYIENILQDPDNAAIVAGDESATGTITAAPDTQGALLTASRSNTSTTKCQPSEHLGLRVGYTAGNSDVSIEPEIDYPVGKPKPQTKYTGKGNGQPKKSKSDKAIPLSSVGRSSPPSETSGDEKTHMIPPTKGRALPVPANQHEPTSTGIGKSASPRLDPLTPDHSKMTSVERNSGAFPRKLPSPGQPPLDPIPSGKKS